MSAGALSAMSSLRAHRARGTLSSMLRQCRLFAPLVPLAHTSAVAAPPPQSLPVPSNASTSALMTFLQRQACAQ